MAETVGWDAGRSDDAGRAAAKTASDVAIASSNDMTAVSSLIDSSVMFREGSLAPSGPAAPGR
jgi:hypothetical protein